jgi:hypothetical protein
MRISLGFVLYVLAILITVVVIAAKYFGASFPPITAWAMRDPAQSLLVALALVFASRYV